MRKRRLEQMIGVLKQAGVEVRSGGDPEGRDQLTDASPMECEVCRLGG
jgi:hypothetical protein